MRVLVVEDEPDIAELLCQGLTEEQYAVDVAGDGEQALDWVSIAQYDLMVLDILLPKRDRLATCAEMRRRGVRTPILILTAKDAVADRIIGLDSGADDYLVKPFAFGELVARLRALSRRPPNVQPTILEYADVSLDTISHTVMRGGRRIDLTSKESVLLEYLMRNPNRVLSRAMITEYVWNYEAYIESNVVDVYVGYLRRKLNAHNAPNLIHTLRGAGYRLSESDDEPEN